MTTTPAPTTTMNETKRTIITIYAMPGSQFTGKVLAALDSRKIDHVCVFVPLQIEKRKRAIPSGGTLVPEMKVLVVGGGEGDETTPSIVPDSEAILHWFDDHYDNKNNNTPKFFPDEQASELSVRASETILAGSVYYFNWVDDEGYNRSMKKTVARAVMPSFVPATVSECVVNLFLKSERAKFRQLATKALGGVPETDLMDRSKIRDILIQELTYFQSFLLKNDDNDNDQQQKSSPYLLGTDYSTAADFSVYVQVERLVGDMGDANVLPSIPELKDQTLPQLERFWKWHTFMRENHPIQFKGKRPATTTTPR